MEKVLSEFGLTKNEIKIYKTLLKLGSALAGELTTKTGIHRRNVYDSIERLIKKGLVGYISKNNRRYYKATDPNHFFSLIEQEGQDLEKKRKLLKSVLPQLMLSKKLSKKGERVSVFEGKKGLISILEDIIRTRKTNHVFSTSEIKFIYDYLEWFHKKRIKSKIMSKMILNKKETKRAEKLAKLPYTEVKLMPAEFDSPLTVNVYGSKVGMLIFSEDPIGILIDDKEFSESFRKYFKLLWSMAQKV